MAGNKAVTSMPTVPSPSGGMLYIVKNSEDYKVPVGGPLGLAYLNSEGTIPAELVSFTWEQITNKPTTFTPSAHTHAAADVTSGVFNIARIPDIPWANVSSKPSYATRWPSFSEVTGKPSTYTPSAHTHDASDITSGVLNIARIPSIPWSSITGEPTYTTRWPSFSEVTSKPTTLSGYGITNGVATSGTQTIGGAKTFTSNVTAPDFVSTSDARLKKDIKYRTPRDRLGDLIEFVEYLWIETDESAIGVIAQQVAQVAPEYVHENPNGFLTVDKASLALEVALGLSRRLSQLENKVR